MHRRLLAATLALTMLTTIPFAPGSTMAAEGTTKYDGFLRAALAGDGYYAQWQDEQGRFSVLVAGPDHKVPDITPASRAGWRAYWEDSAAPLVDALRAFQKPGDVWSAFIPAGNLVSMRLTPERIAQVALLPEVKAVALDWPEAVSVLEEPLPDLGGPGVAMGQSVGMTGAFDLQALGFYGQGVSLGMIDTGIEHTHSMFLDEFGASRVVGWYDATSAGCTVPCDTHGHGTHTASTAAGSDIAGGRYQGVAPRADITGIKIFIGGGGTWEDAQEGLQASADLDLDITSNSWGGGCGNDPNTGGWLTQRVAENTAAAGVLHVFAAGNGGAGSAGGLCPGRSDKVIAVAAVDKNKVIASFSSGGLCPDSSGGNTRICPDVAAVGVNVDAAWLNNGYSAISGTSMATPHVAGGAVLMYQMAEAAKNKAFTGANEELELFFEGNAEDLGQGGNDQRYGWGFIRLAPMGSALLSGADSRVTVDVRVDRDEMRARDTNVATVTVRNVAEGLLARTVTGTWRVQGGGELSHDGQVWDSGQVTLAPGEQFTTMVDIAGTNLDPTTYHVVGGFDYTWQTLLGETVSASIEDFTEFILRGVKMSATRTGLDKAIWMGSNTTSVTLTLRNVGNEPATSVNLREGVPLPGFVIEPRTSPNPNNPNTLFSNPAPTSVAPNTDTKTLDLTYTPSSVNPNSVFTVGYRIKAGVPGTYDFVALVTYEDGIGDDFSIVLTQKGTASCPGVGRTQGLGPVPPPC